MPEGFRELAPDDEVIPFAKGEIPATYGGPMGSSPKGFRELAPDEEFIPLKPPEPSLMERATGAVKSAASTVKNALPALPSMPSIPSMETVKSYLPSVPELPSASELWPGKGRAQGWWDKPSPGAPKELNQQYAVDDTGNVTDTTTGRNILDPGQLPPPPLPKVNPPVPQNPNPLAGIKERLRSLIPTPSPQIQVGEMPDMGANNIPSATEPVPPLAGASRVRAENEAAKGWKDRLAGIAKSAGNVVSNALVSTLTPPLDTPAAQKMVPFPGLVQAIQGKPPMTTDLAGKPTPDLGAIVNPMPEIVSDAFRAGTEAISSIKPEFYPTLGQDIAGAINTAMMNAPGSPHVPLGQALRYARGRLFGDWGNLNPEMAAKLSSAEPLRDLSPDDASAVAGVARQSSDAHVQAALKILDPNLDPRYKIYADEWARRQAGARPEAPAAAPTQPGGEQPPGPSGGMLEGPEEPVPPAVQAKAPAPKPTPGELSRELSPPGELSPAGFTEIKADTPIEPLAKGEPTAELPFRPQAYPPPAEAKPAETPAPAVEEKPPEAKPEAQVASAQGAKDRLGKLEQPVAEPGATSPASPEPSAAKYEALQKQLSELNRNPEIRVDSQAGRILRDQRSDLEREAEIHQPAAIAKAQAEIDAERATRAQAKPPPPSELPSSRVDPYAVAERAIAAGVDRQGAYSRYVQEWGLRASSPLELGAKEFGEVYDRVKKTGPAPIREPTKPAEAKPSIEEKIAAAEAEQKRLREAAKAKAAERVEKAKAPKPALLSKPPPGGFTEADKVNAPQWLRNFDKQIRRTGVAVKPDGTSVRILESDAERGKFDVVATVNGARAHLNDPAKPMTLVEAQAFAANEAARVPPTTAKAETQAPKVEEPTQADREAAKAKAAERVKAMKGEKGEEVQPTGEREQLIEKIVKAASRKPMPVVESVELKGTDGKWYSGFGLPFGVKSTGERRVAGYSYLSEQGTRVGTRQPTREAAEQQQAERIAKSDDEFRQHLKGLSDQQLREKADYWLKDKTSPNIEERSKQLEAENAKLRKQVPPSKETPPPPRSKKLLRPDQISDFQVGRDKVERRGNRTFVVDTSGNNAPVEVQHDAITPETEAKLRDLPTQRLEEFRTITEKTPYLSPEGKAERLKIFDELQGKQAESKPSDQSVQDQIARLERENAQLREKKSEAGKPQTAEKEDIKAKGQPEAAPAVEEIKTAVKKTAQHEGERPAQELKSEIVSRLEALIKAAPSKADIQAQARAIYNTRPSNTVFNTSLPAAEREKLIKANRTAQDKWEKKNRPKLERLDKATVTIKIPGDGDFTVLRTKESLSEVLQRAKGIKTSIGGEPHRPFKVPIPKPTGKPIEGVKATTEEGDPETEPAVKEAPKRQRTGTRGAHGYPEPQTQGFPELRKSPKDVPQSVSPLERNYQPPAGANAEPIQRRGDIIRDLQEAFQVPIRSGHGNFSQMKARGFFKVKEEVIRLKKANDMQVAAHEIGHFLSKKFIPKRAPGKKELIQLGKDLYGSRHPHGGYREEGVAEFIQFYVTNPDHLKTKAPQFLKYFEEDFLPKNPDIGETLSKARADWKRYKEQPPVARVLSQVSVGEKDAKPITLAGLYKSALDDLHYIKVFENRMSEGREPLNAGDSPYTLARLFRGWTGRAELFLKEGPIDYDTFRPVEGVKPLNEILGPFQKNLDDLRAYLVARRAAELMTRGKETGLAADDVRATLDAYNDKPHFVKAAEELQKYNNALLDYTQKAGVLSKKSADKIKELNQEYVPFYRLMEGHTDGMAGGNKFANLGKPVKKFKGSSREIIDPLESIVKNTYAMINVADRNAVADALVRLAESGQGMGKYIEKVPRGKVPVKLNQEEVAQLLAKLGVQGEVDIPSEIVAAFKPNPKVPGMDNILSRWKDGQSVLYQVHPDLYEAMAGLDRSSRNLLINILSIPARTLRLGATVLSPEFAVRNPVRDAFSAALYSQYGIINVPGSHFVRGLFHILKKDDLYNAWKAGGGQGSMLVSLDRGSMQKTLKQVIDSGQVRGVAKTVIIHPIDSLRALSELGEAATRVGEFSRAISSEGGLTKENILRGAMASREVTLDFARMGSAVKASGMNQAIAFLNANMQGFDKMGRFAKEHPSRFLLRALATITIPSLLLYLMNQDDPRYDELPRWQKDLFWIVPSGSMDKETWKGMSPEQKAVFNKDHTIWRIPKPFEPGLLFGSALERVLEWIKKNDPQALKDLLNSALSSLPNPIPTAAIPLIENMANYSLFRERRIVPRGKEDVAPAKQYTSGTSEAAKAAGQAIGYSPAKIENLVRGYFGGLGQVGLDIASQPFSQNKKAEEPQGSAADVPVVRGFVARFPGQPESIERFYKAYGEAQEKKNTYDALRRERKLDEAKQYRQDNRDAIAAAASLERVARNLATLRKQADLIKASTTITPEAKRIRIDAITFRIADYAKKAVEQVRKTPSAEDPQNNDAAVNE